MKSKMKIPTLNEAKQLLNEAEQRNPGPWVQHVRHVSEAAKLIALHIPELDAEKAEILAYLHDIGRREGVNKMRHIIDGYNFLIGLGYADAARISLTHSFPIKDINSSVGEWDCSKEEKEFVNIFIQNVEYDLYDKLIQLCDSIALSTGCVIIEKRLVDVTLRYGCDQHTVPRWKAYLSLKDEFDKIIGKSIYSLLPEIVENSMQ